jgi:hypothetical protein
LGLLCRGKRTAKQVALYIIDEFLERAKMFERRTKGLEYVFMPVLETLKDVVEVEKVEWDNVPHIMSAIMNTFLMSFLYDCMNDEGSGTCRDAFYGWLKAQIGTPFEWIARKVAKELNLPIEI